MGDVCAASPCPLTMFLAQSGKSQVSGDRIPRGVKKNETTGRLNMIQNDDVALHARRMDDLAWIVDVQDLIVLAEHLFEEFPATQ